MLPKHTTLAVAAQQLPKQLAMQQRRGHIRKPIKRRSWKAKSIAIENKASHLRAVMHCVPSNSFSCLSPKTHTATPRVLTKHTWAAALLLLPLASHSQRPNPQPRTCPPQPGQKACASWPLRGRFVSSFGTPRLATYT